MEIAENLSNEKHAKLVFASYHERSQEETTFYLAVSAREENPLSCLGWVMAGLERT